MKPSPEKDMSMTTTTETLCGFDEAWIGRCKQLGNPFCEKHTGRVCVSCGAIATRNCEQTGQFVCGENLCGDCEHTIFPSGTNGGVGFNAQLLPDGMRRHCKKTEQKYQPWYAREEDVPQPALDAGEWRLEAMPVHGWRIVDAANKEIVGNIYREEDASRIVDDHAIARTVPGLLSAVRDARASAAAVPKLLEALRSLLDQFYPHQCKPEGKDCAKCKALLKGSTVKREVEALTTVQGKEQE